MAIEEFLQLGSGLFGVAKFSKDMSPCPNCTSHTLRLVIAGIKNRCVAGSRSVGP